MDLVMSPRRVGAMVLRYWYLLRGSWPRIFELIYWPSIQVVLWGLISQFMASNSSWVAQAAGVLMAGVLLWDVMFRGQLGVALCFLEEMWSRNLGHLFVSPLRPHEWLASLMLTSLLRTLIGVLPAALLAIPLYGFSIFGLGWPLAAFFANLLVMGWALSLLIVSLILRHGMAAESLAWMAVFVLAPLSAVYYPVSVLPDWLESAAWLLPSVYVFEGMREVMFHGRFDAGLMAGAVLLNIVYLSVGVAVFMAAFRRARERGALLQQGE